MAAPTSEPMRRGRARWSRRPAEVKVLRQLIDQQQPRFWPAVVEDARVTAQYRRERHEFRSAADRVAQVVRLAWVTDSFLAQLCYRAKVECRLRGIPVAPALLHRISIAAGQVSIGDQVVMHPGIYLPHGQVVIDGVTVVERGAVIRPFVTLGLRDGHMKGPHIGPHAKIGTGAKLFGPVTVGAGAQVGANAVVTRDVPAGRTAVGVPARVLS